MTTQSKHTPGPWAWVGTTQNPKAFAYLGNPNHKHDYVFVNLSNFEPTPANSCLIASAPELLEALEALLVMHSEQMFICGEDDETMVKKTLSIARADGGQP